MPCSPVVECYIYLSIKNCNRPSHVDVPFSDVGIIWLPSFFGHSKREKVGEREREAGQDRAQGDYCDHQP